MGQKGMHRGAVNKLIASLCVVGVLDAPAAFEKDAVRLRHLFLHDEK